MLSHWSCFTWKFFMIWPHKLLKLILKLIADHASVHSSYWIQVQFSGMNHQWFRWPDDASRTFYPVNIGWKLASFFLILPVKLVVCRMAWWCYCLYWKVKLIQQKLNSNEFEVWLADKTSVLIFEQVAPSTNLSKIFDFEEHFLKWILLRMQQRKVTLNLFRECSCRHFACS